MIAMRDEDGKWSGYRTDDGIWIGGGGGYVGAMGRGGAAGGGAAGQSSQVMVSGPFAEGCGPGGGGYPQQDSLVFSAAAGRGTVGFNDVWFDRRFRDRLPTRAEALEYRRKHYERMAADAAEALAADEDALTVRWRGSELTT